MIDAKVLLADCVGLVNTLVDDLRERAVEEPDVAAALDQEFAAARDAARTAMTFVEWREERLTQVAVGWVLSCVFVRFCEDNGLIETKLSGSGDRLGVGRNRYTAFVTANPAASQQEYLLGVFQEMRSLSATARLFGEHNAVWQLSPSAFGCSELLEFWWQLDDATGELSHDFADPDWDTRFLGDLYQDVSADVRERYALLQTPVFVESFILDRTLDPAIDEFGLEATDLIDPACGSGHFLLGAFQRLFDRFHSLDPTGNPVGHAQEALARVCGVDLNPYAVAIARFRLLVAALRVCGITRLADAPAFGLRVAVGDSLLHGTLPGQQDLGMTAQLKSDSHLYTTEDPQLVTEILSKTYKAVVANPPYITVKDKAANAAYRARYGSCKGTYSMAVPFFERIYGLAQSTGSEQKAGFTGQITANSFMKREFGSRLVQEFLPGWDLTGVVDTSGAYLPGHGTPTIIVFGRNQRPKGDLVRAVMGLRGEPSTPADPARGLVWTAICDQIDDPGSTSDYVQAVDWPRSRLHQHPMIFGGGAELWFRVDIAAETRLGDICSGSIGRAIRAGADEAYIANATRVAHSPVHSEQFRPLVVGEDLRDWSHQIGRSIWYPYDASVTDADGERLLWPLRELLAQRGTFQGQMADAGLRWYEYMQHTASAYTTPLSITFAFVATHNHFVLDRGGKVFNRSAPVIKLPADATEKDHLELLGPLNSSIGCFWLKQVMHDKGNGGYGGGIASENWERFYEFTATQTKRFPLAVTSRMTELSAQLDQMGQMMGAVLTTALGMGSTPSSESLKAAEIDWLAQRSEMVSCQEELDWAAYVEYGLADASLAPSGVAPRELRLGLRAAEVLYARRAESTDLSVEWFDRHGSVPQVELPSDWEADYTDLVERRIVAIEADPAGLGFVEQLEFKRRWNWESWEDLQAAALRDWLLDAVERLEVWKAGGALTVSGILQELRHAEGFAEVAELYGGADVELPGLVEDLLSGEAVPHAAGLRLKKAGMVKRAVWEQTWKLQRAEDAIDARATLAPADPHFLSSEEAAAMKAEEVGAIPKPPAYKTSDMAPGVWPHRGKLDVPKERFISYPGAEAADGDTSAVFGWAGWDHAEQGRALAALFMARKTTADREVLVGLLAGVWELVPWVKQWHNEPDDRGRRQGDQLERFVTAEAMALGVTVEDLTGWTPEKK